MKNNELGKKGFEDYGTFFLDYFVAELLAMTGCSRLPRFSGENLAVTWLLCVASAGMTVGGRGFLGDFKGLAP